MTKLPLIFILTLSTIAHAALQIDPDLGKITGQCKTKDSPRHVWVFKQWHLGPSVDTRSKSDFKQIPQEVNQTAIFKQLDSWISKGQLKEVFAEGCSGVIDSKSTISYNGWTLADLKTMTARASYPEIVTSVPLKIEAKYDKAVATTCGDDPQLVKENNLAFSDARGAFGFLSTIVQFKNDPARLKPYMDGVVELYKMPQTTTAEQAIQKLKQELKASIQRAKDTIEKRNKALVEKITGSGEKEVAVVYGGAHAAGIERLLDDQGIGCTIVEPTGYQDDESQLLEKLDQAVRAL